MSSLYLQKFEKNKALLVEDLAQVNTGIIPRTTFLINWQVKMTEDFVGVREKGNNLGEEVEFFQAITGTKGQYYCASFVVRIINDGICKTLGLKDALPRIAATQKLFTWAKDSDLLNTTGFKRGDLVIWRKYKLVDGKYIETPFGHIGTIITVLPENKELITVEANTDIAKDREGDGVYQLTRSYDFNKQKKTFRIRGCIDMEKVYNHLFAKEKSNG